MTAQSSAVTHTPATAGVRGGRLEPLAAVVDAALLCATLAAGLLLRYDGDVPANAWRGLGEFAPIALAAMLASFFAAGVYGPLWQHASAAEAKRIIRAELLLGLFQVLALLVGPRLLPLSVPIVAVALHTLLTGGTRFYSRLVASPDAVAGVDRSRVLLVGAGDAGARLLQALTRDPRRTLEPVGFLDDDAAKHGRRLGQVTVLGPLGTLPQVAHALRADEILLTIPSADQSLVRRVSDLAERAHLPMRLLPPVSDLVHGQVTLADVREVRIDDLLGRAQVETDLESVAALLRGRRVMITGAGGSIGSEIARQVAGFGPAELLLLDHDETHLYDIVTTLDGPAGGHVEEILADIRQRAIVNQIFARYRPQVVFHAAAHKHVPLLEEHPCEAVKTNVSGTDNLVAAASVFGVERFVFISTDKAVRPSSVMGATKRLGEHIVLSAPAEAGIFCAVRFGNVLGSRGSVVPTFLRQIKAGGPVTVTDPRMTRFFMSIPEAVQLVLQAAAFAEGGEVFMLDMGEPVNIRDLAGRLVRLQGRRVGIDVEIRITGTRPGEKLSEELHAPDESPLPTAHRAIVQLLPEPLPAEALAKAVTSLGVLAENADDADATRLLFDLAAGRIDEHERGLLTLRYSRRASDRDESAAEPWRPGTPRRRLSDFVSPSAAPPEQDRGRGAQRGGPRSAPSSAEVEDSWTSSTT